MSQQVVIVGAGFSGTLTAIHLLRDPDARVHVTLVDRTGRFGPGVAYATRRHEHVLNVPAGRMGAFPEAPGHFLEWLKRNEPTAAGAFVPRALYGRYLAELLTEAAKNSPGRLETLHADIDNLLVQEQGVTLTLRPASGPPRSLHATHAVLATGNFPPSDPSLADPSFFRSPRYHRDPWQFLERPPEDLLSAPQSAVLLIGTGLTMIDVALTLSQAGMGGRIHAISRRGLLPAPHRPEAPNFHPTPPADIDAWPCTTLGLLKRVRSEIERAGAQGRDWREVITSLRSNTPALWRKLDDRQKTRFVRWVRPYWDVSRHRTAPNSATLINSLIDAGQLSVQAGRLLSITDTPAGAIVEYRPRGGGAPVRLTVSQVVNCTGPDTRCAHADPLLATLAQRGVISPDSLELGLRTQTDGRLLDARGTPQSRLWLVGPMRRADLWEATAVPELRIQAAQVAASILETGRHASSASVLSGSALIR
ncbi:MAG: FAD/NAD(P)-binding protein [Planctomycetota bacterium]|nr:FAD/NAD(P)-binding protein [Planctomycetota bacterium]